MADNSIPDPDSPGDKSKLPPRAGDWHSGLKNGKNKSGARSTAPETVSDFLATSALHPSEEPVGLHPAGGTPVESTTEPRTLTQTVSFYTRSTGFGNLLIGLILGLLAFYAVFSTYRGIGHSWDEALYLKPAERAAAWMMGVFNSGDDSMLHKEVVDRHWGKALDSNDPLHPEIAPVPKLLDGAGLTYLTRLGFPPMMAMRLPAAGLFGFTVMLIFLLGAREYGRVGGFAAAIAYGTLPRVFGHAHIAASETPLTFFVLLTVWFFLVANRYWMVALFTGIAFGLAVGTKVSALMLPIPLLVWGQIYKRRDYASNIFAMAFIAPVILLAVWPWLWYDGLNRFFSYLLFYTGHQQTAVHYLGRTWGYGRPSAPFYYPLHMISVVTPVWVLAFLALGLLRALFSTVRRPVTVLFVLLAFCWVGLSMLPGSPRYDGERLFFPAFAFLALLAGGGFSLIFGGFRSWRERRGGEYGSKKISVFAGLALAAVAAYGAATLYRTHPNELNYYNEVMRGTPGAYRQGFETSYWGEALNEDVTGYLTTILKPGDTVKTLALNELAFDNLRQWGHLPADVDFSPDEPPYNFVVMQARQGFMGALERRLFRTKKPIKQFDAQGVPRLLVYNGSDLQDIFPSQTVDKSTTATESVTTASTFIQDLPTSPARMLPSLVTTETETVAFDEIKTASNETTDTLSSAVVVLDLPTSTSATTSTEERLSTVAVELLTRPADLPTSAPRIYEGTLPATGTVLMDQPD